MRPLQFAFENRDACVRIRGYHGEKFHHTRRSKNVPDIFIFRLAYIYPVEPRKEPNFSNRLLRAIYPAFRCCSPTRSFAPTIWRGRWWMLQSRKQGTAEVSFLKTVRFARWGTVDYCRAA